MISSHEDGKKSGHAITAFQCSVGLHSGRMWIYVRFFFIDTLLKGKVVVKL